MENELIRKLAGAIEEQTKKAKSKSYDTQATVKRVEGETVWVHIPGGVDETPVSKTIACSAGDTVQVRVTNGRGFIVGNGSAPPTDDTTAIISKEIATEARYTAETALEDAVTAHDAAISATESAATAGRAASVAQAAADAAQETANSKKTVFVTEPTPPYHVGDLWVKFDPEIFDMVDSDGNSLIDDQGDLFEAAILKEAAAYVCMVPKLAGQEFSESDFELATADNGLREWFWHDANGAHVLGDVTGFRNDLTSTGMKIVDTSTETSVAQFGSSGARIGKTDDSHIEMNYNALKLKDKNGVVYVALEDLRGEDGTAEITQTFKGDGSTTVFYLLEEATSTSYTVEVNGSAAVGVTKSSSYFTFSTAPARGAVITADYESEGDRLKAYTLGFRRSGYPVGVLSMCEGMSNRAEGILSHAEGYLTIASGGISHAEGFTSSAQGDNAHAEGNSTTANGDNSHAQNIGTVASSDNQTALGTYNEEDDQDTYAVIIGNGTANDARSNAVTVDWSGNVETAGDITDGSLNKLSDKIESSDILPLFDVVSVNKTFTVSANSTQNQSFAPAAADVPSGYTRVGLCGWNTANGNVFIVTCTGTTITFGNKSSSNITCTNAQVDWLYIRSSL